MSKFVLTAQLQLQAPSNVGQVVKQIQNQLNSVNVNIKAQGAAQAIKQVNTLSKSLTQADKASYKLGKTFTSSLKRFAAFSVATRAVSLLTQGIGGAISEAMDFERELMKVAQVTGRTVGQLKGLTNEITRLGTSLGVSSRELLAVSRSLSQAGFSAYETKIALDALAKSSLAPTFDDMAKTAEGAIAIFNQFGKGAAALEGQLGAINAVAGKFAVEAGDLISVIRRTGGVFKSAGGDLNELIALFTSVRSTTRESAESIATGLRTIFTRIQRPRTIQYLKEMGISLTDLEGKFVGPFEAIKRLSAAFGSLEAGDLRFVQIAEQLGGFRQIGKVIPLIQQFAVSQEALNVALGGTSSLAADAEKAQGALTVKIQKLKEEWFALIRGFTDSTGFKVMTSAALNLATAVVKMLDVLKDVLPVMLAMQSVRMFKGMGGFMAGAKSGAMGSVPKFASGGMVPGSGNGDTVPAMLTPGEFVIRKSSVKKMGSENLKSMNAKGYAKGGTVKLKENAVGGFFLKPEKGSEDTTMSYNTSKTRAVTNPTAYNNFTKGKRGTGNFANAGRDLDPTAAQPSGFKLAPNGAYAFTDATSGPATFGKGNSEEAFASLPRKEQEKYLKNAGLKHNVKNTGSKLKWGNIDFANAPARTSLLTKNLETKAMRPQSLEVMGRAPKMRAFFLGGQGNSTTSKVHKAVTKSTVDNLKKMVKDVTSSDAVASLSKGNAKALKVPPGVLKGSLSSLYNPKEPGGAVESIEGFVNEGLVGSLTGAKIGGGGTGFDFPDLMSQQQTKERLKLLYGPDGIGKLREADAKRSLEGSNEKIFSKAFKTLQSDYKGSPTDYKDLWDYTPGRGKKMAKGGPAGTDTVPALLTPGEFVVNAKSAQSIGHANLDSMNKRGVAKFAAGGAVGPKKFAGGGGVMGGGGMGAMGLMMVMPMIQSSFEKMAGESEEMSEGFKAVNTAITSFMGSFIALQVIMQMRKKDETSDPKSTGDGAPDTSTTSSSSGSMENDTSPDVDKIVIRAKLVHLYGNIVMKGSEKEAEEETPAAPASVMPQIPAADTVTPVVAAAAQEEEEKPFVSRHTSPNPLVSAQGDIGKTGKKTEKNNKKAANAVTRAIEKMLRGLEAIADKVKERGGGQKAGDIRDRNTIAPGTKAEKDIVDKKLDHVDKLDKDRSDLGAKGKALKEELALIQEQEKILAKLAMIEDRRRSKPPSSPEGNAKLSQAEHRIRSELAVSRGQDPDSEEVMRGQTNFEGETRITQGLVQAKQVEIDNNTKQEQEVMSEGSAIANQANAMVNSRIDRQQAESSRTDLETRGADELGFNRLADRNSTDATAKLITDRDNISKSRLSGLPSTPAAVDAATVGIKPGSVAEGRNPSMGDNIGDPAQIQEALNRLADAFDNGVTWVNDALVDGGTAIKDRLVDGGAAIKAKAKGMATTIATKAVTIKDALVKLGGDLKASPLKTSLKLIAAPFKKFAGIFQKQSKDTETNAKKAKGAQGGLWRGVKKRGTALTSAISDLANRIKKSKIGQALGKVGKSIGKIASVVGPAIKGISDAFKEFANDKFNKALDQGNMKLSDLDDSNDSGGLDGEGVTPTETLLRTKNQADELSARSGGAMSGAMTGLMMGGPIGAVVGGLVGAFGEELSAGFSSMLSGGSFSEGVAGVIEGKKNAARSKIAQSQLAGFGQEVPEMLKNLGGTDEGKRSTALEDMTSGLKESQLSVAALEKTDPKAAEKASKDLDKTAVAAATAIGSSVRSRKELDDQIKQLTNAHGHNKEAVINAAKAAYTAAEALRAVAKMRADILVVTSIFGAAGLAVDNFAGSLVTGSNTMNATVNTLKEAQKNIALGQAGTDAVEDARKEVFNRSGIDKGSGAGQAIDRQFDVLAEAAEVTSQLPNILADTKIAKGNNPTEVREQLTSSLTDGMNIDQDSEMGKIIAGQVGKLTDDQIAAIQADELDLSTALGNIGPEIAKLGEGALKAAEALQKHENTIIKMTQERMKMESNLVKAQEKAIDLHMEAAKIASKAGGRNLNARQKRQAVMDRANVGANAAGVRGLGGSSGADIRSMSGRIAQQSGMQSMAAQRPGAFSGPQGLDADKRQKLAKAQQDLIKTTKDLITIEQEELKIVKEKNRLERSALEALIGGNVESFVEQSNASGATSAVASGSDTLMSMFGAEEMAGAFKNISQMQSAGVDSFGGMDIGTLKGAAGAKALSMRGINDASSAAVLTGQTAEEENSNARIRDLAGGLSAIGENAAQMAEMEVNTANINIANANIEFTKAINSAAGQFSKGGPVYASTGMFIPRGTDTVPAMLTPGEFVINRASVNRGNNLQILKAINSGSSVTGESQAMSSGGSVGYYAGGGGVGGGGAGLNGDLIEKLSSSLRSFNTSLKENIDRLQNTKFQIKLDTTNVNVTLNSGGFLRQLKSEVKDELLAEVGERIKNIKISDSGEVSTNQTIVGG